MPYAVYMANKQWGKKKKMCLLTIQGALTEKQYEEVYRRMLKIAEKFDIGFGADYYDR